jgi:hypothetical protein
MTTSSPLLCDGCGQAALPEHIARRLQRLEWTTRYRPVHIQAVLLSGAAPVADDEFLYSPNGANRGESARLLEALEMPHGGRTWDTLLTDFQRRGLLLAHVMECPIEDGQASPGTLAALFSKRIPAVITRIRRSLKPKRVVLISQALGTLTSCFMESELGCPVLLDSGKPFVLDGSDAAGVAARLREALPAAATAAR